MGNCLLLLGLKKEKRPVTLLLVGLDNAGKTTAAKGIVGESVEDVAPTVGFAPECIEYRGCEITIYDLGGGSKIRPVWAKYYSEVHGVIFVVDSSNSARIRECRDVLLNLLANEKISGKPVLVLANKQDVEGAMDEIDLVESLNVEQVVNKYKCPTRVETCSAITTRKHKPDKPIADGFRWLIDTIVVHYKEINTRVENDLEKERELIKKEMEERKERIRMHRAERERQEALRNETVPRDLQADIQNGDDLDIVTANITQQAGSSGIPNGTLPQSKNMETQKAKSCSVDEEELKELGFTSQEELQESTSSVTTPQASVDDTQAAGRCLVSVQASPSTKKEDSLIPCTASKPHRVILVQESPKHLAASAQELPKGNSPSSDVMDGESRYLDPKGFANTNAYGTAKLDLFNEKREDECVPIDSDDELFDVSSSSRVKENPSPFTVRTPSDASIMSYVKAEHLELESTNKASKKKSFLKRYHKTAPLIPNTSPNAAGNQEVNHNSRVPPPLA
ncbi:uncharacterized protein [Panulirus ornatus]|uniref:uncharacterized protein isoform X2 n=1 Tax=Panulirus ornatus TaxID=150431 RepID=UPI003A851B43